MRGISRIRVGVTVPIIHTRINLRIIFGFRYIHFLHLLLKFTHLLIDSRMPIDC